MTTKQNERYSIEIEGGRRLKIVPEPNTEQLNEKQLVDYCEHRWEFAQGPREKGNHSEKHRRIQRLHGLRYSLHSRSIRHSVETYMTAERGIKARKTSCEIQVRKR